MKFTTYRNCEWCEVSEQPAGDGKHVELSICPDHKETEA